MNKELYLRGAGTSLVEKLLIFLIITVPLLLIWQGLDFTDTGYILTNYQQVFNDPESISASFRIWMTNIIGGVWLYLFGDSLGLIGYRLAGVLIAYATLYPVYLILRPFFERKRLLAGFFLAIIFINRSGYHLNYNTLTAFFNMLGAYFLVCGLLKQKNALVFFAGFVLAVNIFVRLPNVLLIALVTSILFYGVIKKKPVLTWLNQTAFFMAGYILAIIAVLALLYGLGQLDSYITAFKGTFAMLRDPIGHHRWDYVVGNYLQHHKNMFIRTGVLFAGFYAFLLVLTLTSKLGIRLLQYSIILAAAALVLCYSLEYFQNWVNLVITVMGVLYFVLIFTIIGIFKPAGSGRLRNTNDRNDFRLVSFVALTLLALSPLGSNIPIWNAVYGMYLAIPLVLSLIAGNKGVNVDFKSAKPGLVKRLDMRKGELNLITAISLGIFLILTLNSIYHYTYRDSENRMAMLFPVRHYLLKGVLTTRERARVVQELVDVLPGYVKQDDYLLAYEQISMVHYLTKTRPYLYNAWPMLYSGEQFKRALDRAQRERPYLPVIVRATGNTEENTWPRPGRQLRSPNHDAVRRIMDDFITDKNYTVVWRNDFFEILLPPSRS